MTDILIVDDDKELSCLLQEYLKSVNYSSEVVNSGEDALSFLNKTMPRMVLLDIMLPIVDGYEVCRKIRADEKTRSLPVVFMTALDVPRLIEKCYKAGGNDVVMKPLDHADLLGKIKKHISANN